MKCDISKVSMTVNELITVFKIFSKKRINILAKHSRCVTRSEHRYIGSELRLRRVLT